jgi:ribosomal protein S18 acetylase RimI-like enzyme
VTRVKIRLARRGDGAAVAALASHALGPASLGSAEQDLAATIDRRGGRIPVPYGYARILVAEDDTGLVGAFNLTPAIRLAEESPELGDDGQHRLANRIGELDFLAVAPGARGQGVGYQLWQAAQALLLGNGGLQLLVQIHQDNTTALTWFSRQGVALPKSGSFTILKFEGHRLALDAVSPDGYRQGIKVLGAPAAAVASAPRGTFSA